MLLCMQYVDTVQKNFTIFNYLNTQTTKNNNHYEALFYDAFEAIYERGLHGHARESNEILLKWINGEIKKADYVNEDYPLAAQPDPCKLKNLQAILMDFPNEQVVRAIIDLNDKDCSKKED